MTETRTPDYWNKAITHLVNADETLGTIIDRYKGETLVSRGNAFYTLCRSIVGQQVSVKAADSMWAKLESRAKQITPRHILKLSEEELRAGGLSRQKIAYLTILSQFFQAQPNVEDDWQHMGDEAVITSLTALKGIGRWTAEMFLIFYLLRPDVFPTADIGLQKAIHLHYNNNQKMEPEKLEHMGKKWQPYRSVATWYLWRSLDPVPVEY